jgi:hypothetical protein
MSDVPKRRRVPRVPTDGWSGKYVIEDDPGFEWHECRVLDISVLGVGIELFPGQPAEITDALLGHQLVVQVQSPVGHSVSVRLEGQVTNVSQGPEGGIRAGLEFVGLCDDERDILNVFELMRVSW